MHFSTIAHSEQILKFRLLGLAILLVVATAVFQLFNSQFLNVLAGYTNLWSFILFGLFAGLNSSVFSNKKTLVWVFFILLLIAFQSYYFALTVAILLITTHFLARIIPKQNLLIKLSLSGLFMLCGAILSSQKFYLNQSENLLLLKLVNTGWPLLFEIHELLVFSFCFLSAFVAGSLVVDYEWHSNYHFRFLELQYWMKLLAIVAGVWVLLLFFGVYSLLASTHVGAVVIAIDFLSIQFVVCFLLIYILLYAENLKLGKSMNKFFEFIGLNWQWFIIFYLLLVLAGSNFIVW